MFGVHGGGHGGWCYQSVARLLRAEGHDVFDFGLGNPDGPSPKAAIERLMLEGGALLHEPLDRLATVATGSVR